MRKILWPAVAALLPFASVASAAPFNSLDARSMAMGDVGVASSQPGSAPVFNSALMSQNAGDETISIILPNIGLSLYADKDGLDAITDIDDEEYLDNLSDAIDGFENAASIPEAQNYARQVGDATSGLNKGLSDLSGKPFNINASALLSVVVPTELIGIGVYVNEQVIAETAPVITRCDNELFKTYSDIAYELADLTADATQDYYSSCGDKVYDGTSEEFVDPTDITGNGSNQSYLTSHVGVAGVTVSEFGVALSHKFNINDTEFSLGVTPKLQDISSYYALVPLADIDDYELEDALEDSKKSENAFNLDLGFSMGFLHDDALIVGVSVKNLLGKSYKTSTIEADLDNSGTLKKYSTSFDLKPQVRAGVAWDLPLGFTVASDLDLTTNKALFNGQDTQYFGLGAEWDVFSVLRLRAGARTNLEESNDTAFTAGLGFNIIAFHMDLAGQFSDNNAGVALQMGVEF